MQLYALDHQNTLTPAKDAKRQADYLCFECRGVVRVRAGVHRQVHFYHLASNDSCRQSGKSMPHLHLQAMLYGLCPGQCSLEHRFDEINRIADCVWWNEKLIFEIQCSAITAQEVRERNRDYSRIGFQCIWILSDKQFNQYRLSAAEFYLQEHPHYFSNMDAEGVGEIYDRLFHRRQSVLLNCFEVKKSTREGWSHCEEFNKRLKKWPLHFTGDLIDRWQPETVQKPAKLKFRNPFKKYYLIVFRMFLEKLSN